MQSETGFPSSHQVTSYVTSKSRLQVVARFHVSGCWPSCFNSHRGGRGYPVTISVKFSVGVVLNRGGHLHSTGRPSRWVLHRVLVCTSDTGPHRNTASLCTVVLLMLYRLSVCIVERCQETPPSSSSLHVTHSALYRHRSLTNARVSITNALCLLPPDVRYRAVVVHLGMLLTCFNEVFR